MLDELWERVQTRRRRGLETIPRTPKGQLLGRPSWRDGHSDYLLPGFASCKLCQGSIRSPQKHGSSVRPGPAGDGAGRVFGCATNQDRGEQACSNRVRLRQEILDQAVLGRIELLLDEELIGWAVDEVLAHVTGHQGEHARRRAELEQELARVDHRVPAGPR